jgi:hypothetical protein
MDTDRANTLTEVRSEILNESTRSLLLINGGGAVAVATWLQAVWSESWAVQMLRPQIAGVAVLLAGVLLAAICPFVRYLSFLHPKTATPFRNPVWWVNAAATALSLMAFLVGMAFVVCGAWRALP